MKIVDLFPEAGMIPELRAADKQAVLGELAERLASLHGGGLSTAVVSAALREREALASTAVGEGVALPHGRLEGVRRTLGVIARSQTGVPFDSLDGKPTQLFFAVVAPAGHRDEILSALGKLSRLLRAQPQVKTQLLAAQGPAEMFAAIAAASDLTAT